MAKKIYSPGHYSKDISYTPRCIYFVAKRSRSYIYYRDQAARKVHGPYGRRRGPGPFVERVVRHVVREHDEEHEQQAQAEPLPRGRAAVGQVVQAGEVFAGGNAGNETYCVTLFVLIAH